MPRFLGNLAEGVLGVLGICGALSSCVRVYCWRLPLLCGRFEVICGCVSFFKGFADFLAGRVRPKRWGKCRELRLTSLMLECPGMSHRINGAIGSQDCLFRSPSFSWSCWWFPWKMISPERTENKVLKTGGGGSLAKNIF